MFIKGRETPMTKNEIAKSEKTMFPDILKKSNFLISSVYRASLLENKVLALALTKVRLSDQELGDAEKGVLLGVHAKMVCKDCLRHI